MEINNVAAFKMTRTITRLPNNKNRLLPSEREYLLTRF